MNSNVVTTNTNTNPYVCEGIFSNIGIPMKIAKIVAMAVKFIQVIVPILLIIWGMLDLGKAVMAQKEDEIKKGQNTFIKRLVAAAIVFFVVTIVTMLVGLVADDSANITKCINEVISSLDKK